MSSLLEVKNISGFPEFLPETQLQFDNFLQTIRRCFQLHGALPIETPAVERISVLQAKETTNKEIYAIRRLVQDEHSDVKDLALKFDLTIPLARYTATHFHQLTFPFRRYQIQPVWRGERPQSGRYRQFYQCDFDIIGNQKLSVNYDAETIFILYDVLKNISIEKFCIHINHRQILNGFLCALLQKDSFDTTTLNAILQIIDGVHKEDKNTITRHLSNLNFTQSQIQTLWEFLTSPPSLKELAQKYSKNTLFLEGIEKLQSVLDCLSALEIPQQHFNIDFSIVRGLDYYTGTIFETFLDNKKIGSIASGGRYDNLTQRFIKRNLPGVGFSLGLSRLFSVLKLQTEKQKALLILCIDTKYLSHYFTIAREMRKMNIITELYLENKKIGSQISYAEKKGYPFVLINGENEFSNNCFRLKNIISGEQYDVPTLEKIRQTILEN